MKVKLKIIDKSIITEIPKYAKDGDAGLDLVATSKSYDENGNVVYGTNLAFEIPKGYVGLLFPRSSNAKMDLILSNSVGVLDSGYRGEIMFKFKQSFRILDLFTMIKIRLGFENSKYYKKVSTTNISHKYNIGDRIGQLIIMPYPTIEFELSDELSDSERGAGGYGSTGN